MIGAGTNVLVVPEVPAAGQVLFAVRFVGDPNELDGTIPHPVSCRIYGPDGVQLGEQSVEITSAVRQLVPGYVADVTIPVGVVLNFSDYGSYGVEFQIDTSAPLRVPIHVVPPQVG